MVDKRMNQTRLESLAEVCLSTAIGYAFAILAQLAIFPVFGISVTVAENFAIAALFTVVSVLRGYVVRRWFNAGLHRTAVRIARRLTGKSNARNHAADCPALMSTRNQHSAVIFRCTCGVGTHA